MTLPRSHSLLLLTLYIICAFQARGGSSVQAYQEWLQLPSAELLLMGNRYNNVGTRQDSAMVCYSIIADRYTSQSARVEKALAVRALNEMGVLNTAYYNDYTAAYQELQLACDICKETGQEEMMPYILLNLGNLYNLYEFLFPSSELAPQAGRYYEQCFRVSCRLRLWNMAISSYINFVMLNMPYGVGEPSIHEKMCTLLRDSIPPSTADWPLACHFLDGNMALMRGDISEALRCYAKMAGDLGGQPDQAREEYMVLVCLSAAHLQARDYHAAICCANKILELRSQQDLTDIRAETYSLLAEYYAQLGDSLQAARCHTDYLETKELLMKNIVGLVPTQLSHDLQEVSGEIGRMQKQKRLQTINLMVAIVIILLLTAFVFFISRKNRQLNEKNAALYRRMQEIIQLEKPAADAPKYKESQLKEEKKQMLVEQIRKVMGDAKAVCQPTFTLQTLAEMLGSNTSYLSQAINEHFGMTFTSLLNQYRVREACRRMEDQDNYGNLTIDAISESVGFKARVTFTKAFKQNVGMLPSEYLKAVKQERVSHLFFS